MIVAVIPARMASTRFPNKPLASLHGLPMIGHVYYRTRLCARLEAAYIATCDPEIGAYADQIGAPWVLTADTHQRASDRAAEALLKIEQATGRTVEIVMMVQGDEPLLNPAMLDQCLEPLLADPTLPVSNLMSPILTDEDFDDSNVVKVVLDAAGCALYLSREPIPSRRKGVTDGPRFKQLGLIAFRRAALLRFAALAPTPLEIIESVDMLRFLEHGDRLRMVRTDYVSQGVDTPADLARAAGLVAQDPITARYLPL